MKKTIQRHQLTAEEKHEASRLRAAWDAFKSANPGVSQEWLGKEAKIGGQSAVSQYLRGDLALNFATLVKICTVLRVAPGDISPRLVEEHLADPSLDADLFARATRASGRLERTTGKSPIRGQKIPLSPEASELIRCVARLDSDSPTIRKSMRLLTGLLLLAGKAGEFQDGITAEELISEAEKVATGILSDKQGRGAQ